MVSEHSEHWLSFYGTLSSLSDSVHCNTAPLAVNTLEDLSTLTGITLPPHPP